MEITSDSYHRFSNMTARDERLVWTVPGAASDPPGTPLVRLGTLFFPGLSFDDFGCREGEA